MNQTQQNTNQAKERLLKFLSKSGLQSDEIELLTSDASTRMFFRVKKKANTQQLKSSLIACVYPMDEAGKAQFEAYLDVTNLFLKAKLPVAKILMSDEQNLIIVHEDFGNCILRDKLNQSNVEKRERLIKEAIFLIAKIQAATPLAYRLNSIASRLKFDTEKLFWELKFFKTHYFESLLKVSLSDDENQKLSKEFLRLSRSLEERSCVLVHRDFHTANLMYFEGQIKIIDHQDARIGSVSYDLVSLLLDRIIEPPPLEWLVEKSRFFLQSRKEFALTNIEEKEFLVEFHLQAIQRCLKAIGTFSYQAAFRGKTDYIPYIRPMFEVILKSCSVLNDFQFLQKVIVSNYDKTILIEPKG